MKTKIILSRIAFAAVPLLVLGGMAFSNGHGQGRHSIAGAWINTFEFPGDPNTLVQTQVITPLDPAGVSFAAMVDSHNPARNTANHTFGRPTGTYVRVAADRYKFTLRFHRGFEPIVFPGRATYDTVHVFSGTAYLSDQDTLINDGVLAIFAASQDVAPRDGFPDEGEIPISVLPWTFESRRVEIQEPYPLP